MKKLFKTLIFFTTIIPLFFPSTVLAQEPDPPNPQTWWSLFFGKKEDIPEEFTITSKDILCQQVVEEQNLGGNLTLDFCLDTIDDLTTSSLLFAIAISDLAPGDEALAGAKLVGSIKQAGRVILILVVANQGEQVIHGTQIEIEEISQLLSYATTTISGQITWPEWDEQAFKHPIEKRGYLKTFLAYEALVHTADAVYWSPVTGKLVITTYDPYVGLIAGIFIGPTNPLMDSSITLERPVTVIFQSGGVVLEQVRRSTCLSWQVLPTTQYDPKFEPVGTSPIAIGRCLELGN